MNDFIRNKKLKILFLIPASLVLHEEGPLRCVMYYRRTQFLCQTLRPGH